MLCTFILVRFATDWLPMFIDACSLLIFVPYSLVLYVLTANITALLVYRLVTDWLQV